MVYNCTYHRRQTECQFIKFLMVGPAYSDSSPRLRIGVRIFLNLFQNLTSVVLSVIGDVLVDSSILKSVGSVLGSAHKDRGVRMYS